VMSTLSALGSALGGNIRNGVEDFHAGFFVQLLFFGGFIVTSLAFREVHQNGAGIFYLAIPASTFEKLASKLLITSVGFVLGSAVFYTATAALSEGVNRLVFGWNHALFNPFNRTVLRAAAIYLVTQSVYLLGSVWFRKLAFVKTALWATLFAIGAAVIAAVAARILLAGHFTWSSVQVGSVRIFGDGINIDFNDLFREGSRARALILGFKTAAEILFWGALAPVCWLAAYFKLGEVEV
jgi:hypothetical protein